MGGGISKTKHRAIIGESEAQLDEHEAALAGTKAEMESHAAESARAEKDLNGKLVVLKEEKQRLDAKQAVLQAEYTDMEEQRLAREQQVIQRVILRVINRCVGNCFVEWKDFVTELVRERDREKYAHQVVDLQGTNTELRKELGGVQAELDATEAENAQQKTKQLMLKLLHREMATCFNQWKGYVRAHVEERHHRQVAALQTKLEEMRSMRDELRAQLDGAELEGLKIGEQTSPPRSAVKHARLTDQTRLAQPRCSAMQKFELEERDSQKESQIETLTQALLDAVSACAPCRAPASGVSDGWRCNVTGGGGGCAWYYWTALSPPPTPPICFCPPGLIAVSRLAGAGRLG
jgi:hypothetical protein